MINFYMKKFLGCFAFLLLLASSSESFAQVIATIPSWVETEDVSTVRDVDAKTIKGGYFYLVVEEQCNSIDFQSFYRYATKVVSATGLESASQIEITFDPSYQKVLLHYIKIRRGDKIIDRTTDSGIKTLKEESERNSGILNGNSTLYANLSDIRTGDIIDYAYSIVGHNQIFGNYFGFDFWFAYSAPVGRIKARLVTQPAALLSMAYKNCKVKPVVTNGRVKTYTWLVNNAQPILEESNVPESFTPYPQVQISNLKNWVEVKEWFSKLFKTGSYNDSKLRQLAASIKAKYPNDIEKQITAMVDFSQKSIRYSGNEMGIYSHKPHLPDYVITNLFGDCKDKSLFLHELLKQINITSYPALLNTTMRHAIKAENPSLNTFDHCILAILYKGKLVFVDPTNSFQSGSFLGRYIPNYEAALLIDGNEKVFTDIPSALHGKTDIVEAFVVDSIGDAILTVESKYSGIQADKMRSYFSGYSLMEIQEVYRAFYLKYASEVEVMDTVSSEEHENNLFTVWERYRLKKFWTKTDSSSNKVTKNFQPYGLTENMVFVTDIIRKYPLEIKYPIDVQQKIVVTLENGWDIPGRTITEDNKFFNYRYETAVNGDTLKLDYRYQSKTDYIPVAEYRAYKTKIDFVDNNMVMTVNSTDINNRIYGFNWLLMLTVVGAVGVSIALCINLYSRKIISEYSKSHDSIGGWLAFMAIGVVLSPVILLITVLGQYRVNFNVDYFFYYFDKTSDYFEPLKGYYILFSHFFNVFIIVSSVFLIVLFFQRKNSFRLYYIGLRLLVVVFLILDLGMLYFFADSPLGADDVLLIKSQQASLATTVVYTFIWAPYVWISERSRHTFVNC